ncbi:F0F1 ATP synthase subunit epsilon [bacterium]|nr:F0F1 ATP synthase subunit epsilon [bacterium]
MAETFKLEITTPTGVAFKGDVTHVKAPGSEGSFGVLSNHTPFITPLQMGAIEVESPEGEKVFATSGGLADVRANQFLILAETAEALEKIDVDRAKAAKERAMQRLQDMGTREVEVERAQAALLRANNRLSLAGK